MTHYELRYWFNGVRRCDLYLVEKQAHKALDRLTKREHPIPARLVMVTTSQNVKREYRDIRKGFVLAVEP